MLVLYETCIALSNFDSIIFGNLFPKLILHYNSMLELYETCIVLSHCDSIIFGNPFPKIFCK